MKAGVKILKHCNSKMYRTPRVLQQKKSPSKPHEVIACTRKYGNPKNAVIGTEERVCAFDAHARSRNDLPGPGSHEPNFKLVKNRPTTPNLDTRSFRLTGCQTKEFETKPGPGHYDSTFSDSKQGKESFSKSPRPDPFAVSKDQSLSDHRYKIKSSFE